MRAQKFNHVPVEWPGLFDLAGVSGAIENFEFAAADTLLQGACGFVRIVLAAGDDDGGTGDFVVMIRRFGLLISPELGDDGVNVAELVAFGEQVGEEMRHRRRAEGGAESGAAVMVRHDADAGPDARAA